MLSSFQEYSRFVYTIRERYPSIRGSTLVLIPLGPLSGTLRGILEFDQGVTLRVIEQIDFDAQSIDHYSYTVSQQGKVRYWYDPQPHPGVPVLASTHPHYKHALPDLKHNRVPAPGISFDRPNLPFLIEEIERDLLSS
jgi:hypothetical protein